MKFSLFKNAFSDTPVEHFSLLSFVEKIREGEWKQIVSKVRAASSNEKTFKRLKSNLPAVTISGEFKTRDKQLPVEERLKKHSGLICIDVDKKDNPKMRTQDLVDREALAQFVSCSGEGIKIIYSCTPVKKAEEHRRIFDAVVQRLEKKGVKIKVDPVVKSIASLQYVSYDPNIFLNLKSKLVIKPLPPIKVQAKKPDVQQTELLKQLNDYIDALGDVDVTESYEDWLLVLFGISYSLGEAGREAMHRLCSNYPEYSREECDEKFDACLELKPEGNPVTIATVFQIILRKLPKIKRRVLAKRYAVSHAVGVNEEGQPEEGAGNSDLAGAVKYKLFLFKKVFDRETNTLVELIPFTINLNAFEALLKAKNFYRFEDSFVHVVDNIVEEVDADDILRIITRHIEEDGDYKFTYNKIEFEFSWEELVHLWRTIRAQGATYNQLTSSLEHWQPNLLKDTPDTSYIPYRNGVVRVSAEGTELIPYNKLRCEECTLKNLMICNKGACKHINKQIWKERILPRDFALAKKPGMFEEFFLNVTGRGKNAAEKTASQTFKRARWYYGYMLHGAKRQSIARAWLLYDIRSGNAGGTGKSIIGNSIGKIRSLVVIDGKQVDVQNRFAFQTVQPWTEVVFIDDPSKFMSLVPLFNMITGDISADRKGREPVVKSVKFVIASNWILEAEGSSESRRQFVTQLDDFYLRWAKEHGDTITPIVDYHGKEFFTDWGDKEWNEFDSFAVRCLQFYLGQEAPEDTIVGDALLIRFIQNHEQELFFELASVFIKNVREVKEGGGIMISAQLLIGVIQEHNDNLKTNKAGRIAREFLVAIGGKKVELTTANFNGQVKTMYRMPVKYSELSFGVYGEKLPTRQ